MRVKCAYCFRIAEVPDNCIMVLHCECGCETHLKVKGGKVIYLFIPGPCHFCPEEAVATLVRGNVRLRVCRKCYDRQIELLPKGTVVLKVELKLPDKGGTLS